jgi:hypothetical protein
MTPIGRLKAGVYEVVPKNANLISIPPARETARVVHRAHVTLLQPVQLIPEDDLPDRRFPKQLCRSASIIGSSIDMLSNYLVDQTLTLIRECIKSAGTSIG